jgi:hypothetical protein
MGRLNQFLTLNGYFFEGEYLEHYYDDNLEQDGYKTPITIRFKQNDAGVQGISGGGKENRMEEDSQGKLIYKSSITIKVADNLPYKPYDKFKILNEDKTYIIKQVFEDYTATNSINNLQFKRMRDNKEYVLVMGER